MKVFDFVAAGADADAFEDEFFLVVEFVADEGVAGEDYEAVADVDFQGMTVLGVGIADDFRPVFAEVVYGRFGADVVFGEKVGNELGDFLGGAFALAGGVFVRRGVAKTRDEFFGGAGEGFWRGCGHWKLGF